MPTTSSAITSNAIRREQAERSFGHDWTPHDNNLSETYEADCSSAPRYEKSNNANKSRYWSATAKLPNVQQRFNQHCVYSPPQGMRRCKNTLIRKYVASREIERLTMKQSEEDKRERINKKRRMMQTARNVLFYLLNPLAAQHQRTAYPSATLMSSNRPGTAVNTHRQMCHTLVPQGTLLTRSFLWDCRELKLLLIGFKCVVPVAATMMATPRAVSYHRAEGMPQEDGVSVQQSLVSAALCCLQSTKKHTHAHTHTKKWSYMSSQAPDREVPAVCLQLHPSTSDL